MASSDAAGPARDGLTATEARARLDTFGPNAIPERPADPWWRRLLRQFASPLIYILLFALAFDIGLWVAEGTNAWPIEAMAIGLILLFNAGLGLYQEQRSEAALSRLKTLAGAHAWVFRDRQLVRIPARALVPGDLVRLEAGDRIPADGTVVHPRGAMVDESTLTGESIPIDKNEGAEAFSGTLLVRGKSLLGVTRTGPSSALGRLATMLEAIETGKTPLERRVDRLGRQIAVAVLILSAALGLTGILVDGLARAPQTIIFAVALAVAAAPEGLPAVLTVALALGVERMARHRAVVRRLAAVEALGSITTIATDKTGTLTEGRMEVRTLDASDTARALTAIVIASDADVTTGVGDPMELGLLRYAAAHGADIAQLRHDHAVVSERSFDSAWKFSRVTVRRGDRLASYVKGAPEVVIDRCALADHDRQAWRDKADAYAQEGARVLGLAWGEAEAEERLTLIGLAMFWDPPRAEVPEAVGRARAAGIRVIMITGDHPATALAVAHRIGIPGSRVLTGGDLDALETGALDAALDEVNVFARVRAEQKLRIVERLQARGQTVAMTGDGVNDAPALKKSDVGVAMGRRGSDVSREVSDLVLLDDNFATIVHAVEEGRGIYENIQTFLRFLFSTNLSEVLVVAGGAMFAVAFDLRDSAGALLVPLTAAQILWINLLTDGLPALALAFDRTPGVMQQPPRPIEAPLLDRPSMRFVIGAGAIKAMIAFALLGAMRSMGHDWTVARAAVFHFMAVGQLLLTYPSRRSATRPLPNAYLHAAVIAGIAIQIGAASLPLTTALLGHAGLPIDVWAAVIAAALMAWAMAATIARLVWRVTKRPPHSSL